MSRKGLGNNEILALLVLGIIYGIGYVISVIFSFIAEAIEKFSKMVKNAVDQVNLFFLRYWDNGVIPVALIILLFIIICVIVLIVALKIKKQKKIRIEEDLRQKKILEEQEQMEREELALREYIKEQEILREKEAETLRKKIGRVRVSDDIQDYVISRRDYARGNEKEAIYRKRFMLDLLKVFGNKCAICGRSDNGFDLDHFIIPKNYGGNFVLMHKDGYLVNNAVPLCQTCNRSKSDESYEEIFASEEELYEVLKKNKKMTVMINDDEDFCETIKSL